MLRDLTNAVRAFAQRMRAATEEVKSRHVIMVSHPGPARLVYSSRTPEDVIYFEELMMRRAAEDGIEIFHTFTRSQPEGWTGYARRIDLQMLQEVAGPLGPSPRAYICGPTLLVESAANSIVQLGIPAERIRMERFGPTGGAQ